MSWPRIMMLGVAGALALAGCGRSSAAGPRSAQIARGDSAALEQAVVTLVNRHRRAHGLPALTADARIAQQARVHSAAMAAGRTPLGHRGFDDRIAALRRVMACRRTAENVAFNQGHRDPAAEAVRGWLGSRGHRANIEGPYELTGVGVASNSAGEVFFTQLFVGR